MKMTLVNQFSPWKCWHQLRPRLKQPSLRRRAVGSEGRPCQLHWKGKNLLYGPLLYFGNFTEFGNRILLNVLIPLKNMPTLKKSFIFECSTKFERAKRLAILEGIIFEQAIFEQIIFEQKILYNDLRLTLQWRDSRWRGWRGRHWRRRRERFFRTTSSLPW
jgi:hypothetical protein